MAACDGQWRGGTDCDLLRKVLHPEHLQPEQTCYAERRAVTRFDAGVNQFVNQFFGHFRQDYCLTLFSVSFASALRSVSIAKPRRVRRKHRSPLGRTAGRSSVASPNPDSLKHVP